MTIETSTYIADWNAALPANTDSKSEGDDHIRKIKTDLQATLPGFAGRFRRIQTKSAAYTAVLNDNGSILRTSGTWTLTGTAVATLGNGWEIVVYNDGSGTITFDPSGAELVNGAATLTIAASTWACIWCDGSAFRAIGGRTDSINIATTDTAQTLTNKTLSGATLTGTTTNSGTISGGTYSGITLSGTTTNSGTISGGTISGITDLAVADGGTGSSTAAGARANLGAGIVDVLNRDVTVVDLVSSTTESTLYTFSVPGGTLSTNRALRLTLIGDYLNNASNSLTIRIKYGATTVVNAVLSSAELADDTNRRSVLVDFLLSAANATNAQVAGLKVSVGAPNTIAGSAAAVALTEVAAATSVAEDSTGALNIVVTGQHSVNSASASFRVHVVQLEHL